jgi:hypothetical protein
MLLVLIKLAEREVEVPLLNVIVGMFRSRSANAGMGTSKTEFIFTVTVPKVVIPFVKYGGLLGTDTVI